MRLIDADALYEKVDESQAHNNHQGISHFVHSAEHAHFKFMIHQAPTIEAEPVRHGRWKKKNGEIYCTNCKKSKWSESFELMLRGFDFCPKCGADMREGGAENDT